MSRSFESMALAPIIDLANHAPESESNARIVSKPDGSCYLAAEKPIRKGEEVLISYGDEKSDLQMLSFYGFSVHGGSRVASFLLELKVPPGVPEECKALRQFPLHLDSKDALPQFVHRCGVAEAAYEACRGQLSAWSSGDASSDVALQ